MSLANPVQGRNISPYNLDNMDLIGEGSFGKIFRADWHTTDVDGYEIEKVVAVKVMKRATRSMVISERNRMLHLRHPNVVRLLGMVQQPPNLIPWLVLEYMEGGVLKDYLQTRILTADQMMRVAWNVAKGMNYLHSKEIKHGDLAARNILLDENMVAKVGDLGYYDSNNAYCYQHHKSISTFAVKEKHTEGSYHWNSSWLEFRVNREEWRGLEDAFGRNTTISIIYSKVSMPCPIRWMAPENLPWERINSGSLERCEASRSFKGDVWAYGMVLFELWSRGKDPFQGYSNSQIPSLVLNKQKPTYFTRVDIRLHMKELMHSCWQLNPEHRPYFETIVRHFEFHEDYDEDVFDSEDDSDDDD